jgi:glycosyltransferase involved in cell wall biosynthesis
MRIARVVHALYPEAQGDYFGTNELSRKQALQGHQVRLYTWSMGNRPSVSVEQNDYAVVRLGGPNFGVPFLFREYPYLPHLGNSIVSDGADIVHAHSHLFLTSLQAGLAAKRVRLPFVVTVHGVLAKRGFPTDELQWAYLRTLGNTVFRLADRVICVSRGDIEEVVALGCPESKVRFVPNAVDSDFFRPGSEERRPQEILWVGRFVPEKRLETLIRAMKLVLSERRAMLRLVGDGPEMSRIQDFASKLGIRDKVVFEGRVGKEEVARFMRGASIFALPSAKEGLPKVLLQALASELAVVASDIPGVDDVVTGGKNGLLFERGDAKAMADSILTLLGDPEKAKMLGRNGREMVVKEYRWERTLADLTGVYQEARETAGSIRRKA